MAIITQIIGQLYDGAGNSARLEYDYDNVDMALTAARVVNGLAVQVFVQITRTNNPRVYGPVTCAALVTTTQTIPTSGAARFGVTLDPNGRIEGAEVQFWS